jgi:hypothetical protein
MFVREKAKPVACQSYQDGYVCRDGFIQKPFCRGYAGCWHCGSISEASLPHCLRGELPDHWITESGESAFYTGV